MEEVLWGFLESEIVPEVKNFQVVDLDQTSSHQVSVCVL